MKLETIIKNIFLTMAIIGFLFALNYTFSNLDRPENVNVVLVLPFIFFLVPYLVFSLYEIKRVESKMQVVPRFLRDIVDNVESGMDLINAIKTTTDNEYGVLNEDVKKLSNQLSWGIDFDTALLKFANNVGSKALKRDFLLVIEARRVGGHVEKILRELSTKISTENLRIKERKSNLASNTFTGYISFLIFIFIIILVYNNLFLGLVGNLQEADLGGEVGGEEQNLLLSIYLSLFTLLAYEIAILSGFLFGLMQENSLISGTPHVLLLVVMTFTGFFFFI